MRRVEKNESYILGELRCDIKNTGHTQGSWADWKGFSRGFINDVLQGKRNVTERLANALGYTRKVVFERLMPQPCTCNSKRDKELCQRKDSCAAVVAFARAIDSGHNSQ